jgi:hypothetical protein
MSNGTNAEKTAAVISAALGSDYIGDHDPLEMVCMAHATDKVRALARGAATFWAGERARGGHWVDGNPRTGAESTWRSIVGQP